MKIFKNEKLLKIFMYLFILLSASEALRMYHQNSVAIKV